MKPISLQFNNINSYNEEFFIDFESLAGQGIFGIFGSTGSGKSTILDAITLALYGEIPRYTKTAHRGFINTAADVADVAFRFKIHQEKMYEVKRGYKRNKKTNGVSITYCQLAEVDGEILADRKERDVDQAVVKLVGLDYNDFTRSIFLPQGKFNEFIFLKGDERGKMMERLFDLENLGKRLHEKIKISAENAKNKLETCQMQIDFFGGITRQTLEEKNKLQGETAREIKRLADERELNLSMREKYRGLDAALTQLTELQNEKHILAERKDEIEAAKITLDDARRAEKLRLPIENIKSLAAQLALAKENNVLCENLAMASHAEAEKYEKQHSETRKILDEEYPVLIKQQQELLANAAVLHELEEIEMQRAELLKNWKVLSDKLKLQKAEQHKVHERMTAIDNELEKISIIKSKTDIPTNALEILHEAAAAEKEQTRLMSEIAAKQTELAMHTKKAETAKTALEANDKLLEQIAQNRMFNHAADLAKMLQGGQPCPVCGAKEHPAPAMASDEIADDVQFKQVSAKVEAERLKYAQMRALAESLAANIQSLEVNCEKLSDDLAAFRGKISVPSGFAVAFQDAIAKNTKRLQLEEEEVKLRSEKERLNIGIVPISEEITRLAADMDNIKAKGIEKAEIIAGKRGKLGQYSDRAALQKAVDDVERRVKSIVFTEKETNDLKIKYQTQSIEAKAAFAAALERLSSTGIMLEEQQNKIKQELAANGFCDTASAEKAILNPDDMEKYDNNITDFYRKTSELEHRVVQLSEHLENVPQDERQHIPQKLNEAQKAYKLADDALMAARERHAVLLDEIEKMTLDLAKLDVLAEEKKAATARYGYINDINQLFRANAFVKYLSARHLHYITTEATVRLKRMTGGQYAIEYDEDTNFLIRDDFAGGFYRSPASLSGGEAFMASLCLALALSTKIQMKSNADISFFFLDEGFGALDRETLDTVVDCLEQLREENLVVGLISHVEEMKERIANKIELNKNERI